MMSRLRIASIFFLCLVLVATSATSKRKNESSEEGDPGGSSGGGQPPEKPSTVLQDTTWIADWSFDSGAPCVDAGWVNVDNRILNDGSLYWDVVADFGGTGGIVGNAAVLGYQNNVCCEDVDGYNNDWYQAIRIDYTGAGSLSFDYLVDSESGFDFLQIEEDSACASFSLVDFSVDPSMDPESFRNVLYTDSGYNLAGSVSSLAVTDFGVGSCIYIAFFSDAGSSPCDGLWPTTLGRAIVVDNIEVVDGSGTRTDDFTTGSITMGTFVNIANSVPFGSWARTFQHITDNDTCTENTTCAWLWTDDGTPTIANDPTMALGPGGYVIRNWLDDIIVSPWVSLSTTPSAKGTIIQFRRFPGNFFATSRIVHNWSVRGKATVDTTTCVGGWGHALEWSSLDHFTWGTRASGMSTHFDPSSSDIQVRFRTADWQRIVGVPPPGSFVPGPGPFLDRVRIGRIVLSGPVVREGIDARFQAQDAFATEIDPTITPGTGEHYRPTTDRFGTTAFSMGADLGVKTSPNLITGDSIRVEVVDVRGAGGITRIELWGAIIGGPHAGLAPPPHAAGGSGFFVIAADSVRATSGAVVADEWFVDIDDEYLVGGDIMNYLWLAEDALGGFSSAPVGLSGVPATVADAQAATNGMFEMSALPAINWDPDFLAAVAISNKVDPNSNPIYLDSSTQANCILYVQYLSSRRRSGDVHRSSFMYTLDALGYRGHYDVYDHQGLGNTNNQLGGRATIEQAEGYNLIVHDTGNSASVFAVTDGASLDTEKIDQLTWYRNWLAQASTSEATFATLWMLGSNFVQTKPTNALYSVEMGIVLNASDQGLNQNPDLEGVTGVTFDQGAGSVFVDFAGDEFSLNGGCPVARNYDGFGTTGSAVATHVYRDPNSSTTGDAGIVVNSNPAAAWNTIGSSFPWSDIRDLSNVVPSPPTPQEDLMAKILGGALALACLQSTNPVDTGQPDQIDAPRQTSLAQNIPNPFNPITRIEFDLARDGLVSLKVYDVSGRLVRTLIDAPLTRGRYTGEKAFVWDGFDNSGQRVSSGVYLYQLSAPGFLAIRKMVLIK
jgi:hypothetical protein